MTGLIVAAAVLAALVLIALIRVGARVRYCPDGLFLTVLAGPAKIDVWPMKKRKKPQKPKKEKKEKPEKKPKKPKKEKKKKAGESAEKPGTLSRLLQLLPLLAEAAGAMPRKLRMDELSLSILWGAGDAASAALGYGQANAILGAIWPILDNNFNVKRSRFHVDVDYNLSAPVVDVRASLTLTVGQIVAFSVNYGVRALAIWIRSGRPVKT